MPRISSPFHGQLPAVLLLASAHTCCISFHATLSLFLCLSLSVAPLVPLESPLESTVVPMGDAEMLRITRSNGMPFFLTPESFRRLDDFAREEHLDKGSRVLVIGGPVKSGKTTVLHEVLPALVAAHRQKGSALPEPVIMRFTFYEVGLPEAAADRLVKEAIRLAAVFGIHITGPSSQSDALNRMDIFLDIICRQFHASGRQLWLLLDEVQVSKRQIRSAAVLLALHSSALCTRTRALGLVYCHICAPCPLPPPPRFFCRGPSCLALQ